MKKILVFDVNETLLDLRALDLHFKEIFGDAGVRQQWFSQFIQSAFVSIITNNYVPFGKIGEASLEMTAKRKGIKLTEKDKRSILTGMVNLPPHKEVPENLEKLKKSGFILAALTNSTKEVAEKQLKNAKIIQYFDKILSADEVKRLKPAKEVYEMAAQSFGVKTTEIRLIAAHAWDIAGALRAGCAAAFIARPGMVLDPLVPKPDMVGKDLEELADQIISVEQ